MTDGHRSHKSSRLEKALNIHMVALQDLFPCVCGQIYVCVCVRVCSFILLCFLVANK